MLWTSSSILLSIRNDLLWLWRGKHAEQVAGSQWNKGCKVSKRNWRFSIGRWNRYGIDHLKETWLPLLDDYLLLNWMWVYKLNFVEEANVNWKVWWPVLEKRLNIRYASCRCRICHQTIVMSCLLGLSEWIQPAMLLNPLPFVLVVILMLSANILLEYHLNLLIAYC